MSVAYRFSNKYLEILRTIFCLRVHHLGNPSHICDICEKAFFSVNELKRHILKTHRGHDFKKVGGRIIVTLSVQLNINLQPIN